MLELAVVEIQHQDEQVWTMKQDEHNQPIFFLAVPQCASILTPFHYGTGSLSHAQRGDISVYQFISVHIHFTILFCINIDPFFKSISTPYQHL